MTPETNRFYNFVCDGIILNSRWVGVVGIAIVSNGNFNNRGLLIRTEDDRDGTMVMDGLAYVETSNVSHCLAISS